MMNKKAKKVISFVGWVFAALVFTSLVVVYIPKLAKIVYPEVEEITALENCGISADEASLLEKTGVEVKVDTWVECSRAQRALKEYYKNELENSHRKVREALGPVGGHF